MTHTEGANYVRLCTCGISSDMESVMLPPSGGKEKIHHPCFCFKTNPAGAEYDQNNVMSELKKNITT